MKKLTFAIDEQRRLEDRKLAREKGISLKEIVRGFLARAVLERGGQQAARRRLEQAMEVGLGREGRARWTREELHER